uniref:Uncharacterized protein LOC113795546 n=1 Tax=Dermatophagoides pteronyssinus TaxID=6956 RepID=A0A6P6Y8B6_DERPT
MVERLPIQRQRKKSIFIPVALYSVTKKLPKNSNANLPRKISSSSNVSIRRNPSNYQDNFDGQDYQQQQQQDGDDYEMRKESAVYGYIEKPEVIEFKGQYYYGGSGGGGANSGNGNDENNQNDDQSGGGDNIGGRIVSSSDHDNDNIIVDDGYPSPPMMDIHRHYDEDHHPPSSTYLPSSSNDYHLNDYHHHNHEPYHHHHGGSSAYPMMSPMYHHHHDSYDDHFEPSISTLLAAKLKKILLVKGITAKGLLLASIPLLLSPLLSYMLTPVVIPITATVAAGRRRRRKRQIFPSTTTISDDNDMDDIEIILKFLQPIFQQNDLWLNKAVANFLNHDGFFQTNDHCFEQLACQIVDDYHQDHHYLNSPSSKTSKLDKYQNTRRVAASLILKHLLQNEFVTKNFKKR